MASTKNSGLTRPILRYHGGKWRLAPWIISHFPEHRVYVEPYGGGASVLLRKQRSYAEIYNDLDSEVVNLFRIARDQGAELRERLSLTPFSRAEYEEAWQPSNDPMEQARRTVVRSFMGFGSAAVTLQRNAAVTLQRNAAGSRAGIHAGTGFRANSNRSGTTPAHDWRNFARRGGTGFRTYTGEQNGTSNRRTLPSGDWASFGSALDAIVDRLSGVVIENKDAVEVVLAHDGEKTLHYADPPYLPETRDRGRDYRHEMTEDDHRELAVVLRSLKGRVIVSGYASPLYEEIFSGWRRTERKAMADGARERMEVLWMNYDPPNRDLFG